MMKVKNKTKNLMIVYQVEYVSIAKQNLLKKI